MKRKSITITAPAATVHISPLGFHRYASEFFRAARAFDGNASFSPVPYYLYCRSLELSFKAFLLGKSVSHKEIKEDIRHNLIDALNKSKALGLGQFVTIGPDQERELQKANDYYVSKGFEYFQITKAARGYPDLPDLPILDDLAGALLTNLECYCRDVA